MEAVQQVKVKQIQQLTKQEVWRVELLADHNLNIEPQREIDLELEQEPEAGPELSIDTLKVLHRLEVMAFMRGLTGGLGHIQVGHGLMEEPTLFGMQLGEAIIIVPIGQTQVGVDLLVYLQFLPVKGKLLAFGVGYKEMVMETLRKIKDTEDMLVLLMTGQYLMLQEI